MGNFKGKAINQPDTYKTDLDNGVFKYIADFKPEGQEDQKEGPTPKEYTCSALAGCIAITLRMYVERKDWDLGNITVEVELGQTEEGEPKFIKKISTEKEITEEQQKKLKIMASKCPVSKMLSATAQETIFG